MGAKKATAVIELDGGKTRTSASLRGQCVCYWWAAGVYGYPKQLVLVTIVALFMTLKAGALQTKSQRISAP